MCGIVGLSWRDTRMVQRMMAAIAHRGPDGDGVIALEHATLGHRRLAVIDLTTGAQPMTTRDGRCTITFNGEIYNYAELRASLEAAGHEFATRSDTEVILLGYVEWREGVLPRLRGDFAFGIYDSADGSLFLARDRLGVKPLYVASTTQGIAFASELKALLQVEGVSRSVDQAAVASFFRYRFVPGTSTLLDDVRRLSPGSWLRIARDGTRSTERYWTLEPSVDEWKAEPAIEAVRTSLVNAVKEQLMSEVPLGVFLSGGVDSAALAAIVSRAGHETKTFTVRFEGDDGAEAKAARSIADAIQSEHHEFTCGHEDVTRFPEMVWHLDEPVSDPATLPVLSLATRAKRHVTVVLAGEGSDEIFGGYDNFKAALAARRASRFLPRREWLYAKVRALSAESNATRLARLACAPTDEEGYDEFLRLFSEPESRRLIGTVAPPFPTEPTQAPLLSRLQYRALTTWLPENFLLKADRMTMAQGLEERVPFLDHRLVSLALSLPPSLKIRGPRGKWVLRRACAPFLPREIARRPKRGFDPPAARWMRGDLGTLYDDLLSRRTHDLYDKAEGRAAFAALSRANGRRSGFFRTQKAWGLLVLEAWHAMMVDGIDHRKVW